MSSPDLSGYVEVHERIAAFHAKYPDGSLQGDYSVGEMGEATVLVYCAKAYRTPDDRRPGIGFASEPVPGRTPYTKGSELMNAETSAWGRALAALGFEVKRGIASASEVQTNGKAPALDAEAVERVREGFHGLPYSRIKLLMGAVGADAPKINRADSLLKAIREMKAAQAAELEKLIEAEVDRGTD